MGMHFDGSIDDCECEACQLKRLQAGPELDALVCDWCEPKPRGRANEGLYYPVLSRDGWWIFNGMEWIPNKQPSTNPTHAGEARRKVGDWELFSNPKDGNIMCRFHGVHEGFCSLYETNGDKGKAEALATTRAIMVALKTEAEVSDG